MTTAPWGGAATGPRPGERATSGTQRRVVTDRRGAPWAVVGTGAHTPDQTVARETVEGIGVPGPERGV